MISDGNIDIQVVKMWISINDPHTQVRRIVLLQRKTKSPLVTNLTINIATHTLLVAIHRIRRRNADTAHLKQSMMKETIVVSDQKNMIEKLTKKLKRRWRRSGRRN